MQEGEERQVEDGQGHKIMDILTHSHESGRGVNLNDKKSTLELMISMTKTSQSGHIRIARKEDKKAFRM